MTQSALVQIAVLDDYQQVALKLADWSELKDRGAFTVVGGPWVSVQEDYFGELADVIFVGEAEETWPRFLEDWKQGRHQHQAGAVRARHEE